MVVSLVVPASELLQAEIDWADADDDLGGCWRRLARTSVADLSPSVAAAVEAFQTAWTDEIKMLSGRAGEHSLDIAVFRTGALAVDEEEAARIRGLLPWALHDAPIEGAA